MVHWWRTNGTMMGWWFVNGGWWWFMMAILNIVPTCWLTVHDTSKSSPMNKPSWGFQQGSLLIRDMLGLGFSWLILAKHLSWLTVLGNVAHNGNCCLAMFDIGWHCFAMTRALKQEETHCKSSLSTITACFGKPTSETLVIACDRPCSDHFPGRRLSSSDVWIIEVVSAAACYTQALLTVLTQPSASHGSPPWSSSFGASTENLTGYKLNHQHSQLWIMDMD